MATLAEVLEVLEQNNDPIGEDVVTTFYEYDAHYWATEDADDIIRQCEDAYRGEYYDGAEYAEEIIGDLYDVPENLRFYIDYERFWDALTCDGYYIADGMVFCPC